MLNDRFKEKSTIGVITTLVTGVSSLLFAPEVSDSIMSLMIGILSTIGIFTKEK